MDRHWGDQFCKGHDPDCRQTAAFVSDDAMVQKTDTHCRGYRPYFDISMPLPLDWSGVKKEAFDIGILRRSTLHIHDDAAAHRELVLFFKGNLHRDTDPSGPRLALRSLHHPENGYVCVGKGNETGLVDTPERLEWDTAERWDYQETMAKSRFAAVPYVMRISFF